MGIIFRILGEGYAYMSLLWFVSYLSVFKKKNGFLIMMKRI